jgi:hypothetical protein
MGLPAGMAPEHGARRQGIGESHRRPLGERLCTPAVVIKLKHCSGITPWVIRR